MVVFGLENIMDGCNRGLTYYVGGIPFISELNLSNSGDVHINSWRCPRKTLAFR